MKVSPAEPAMPFVKKTTHTVESYKGIPLKLELAARFMAALLTDTNYGYQDPEDRARIALREADDFGYTIYAGVNQHHDQRWIETNLTKEQFIEKAKQYL